ncbi:cingulin-like isoform X2 [Penaeus japonicus]|nr:cingulin-like isoform X2 [Penaeus japonicus]
MADEYPEQNTLSSLIKKPPSDCTEAEQDSDSVWTSASECQSETGSQGTSAESFSFEPPTVRVRPDKEDEIERLIQAAESLALERAKLRQSSFNAPGNISASKENTPKVTQQELKFNTPLKKIKNYYSHSEKIVGDIDSGYFGNNEEPNKAREALSSGSFLQESNIQAGNGVEGKFTHAYDSNNDIPRDHYHSPHSSSRRDSQTRDYFFTTSPETSGRMNIDDIPRLSLDSIGSVNPDREMYEERTRVSKDVKEVCNSSIREFTSEESQNPQGRSSLGRPSDSIPFYQSSGNRTSVEISTAVHEECSKLLKLSLNSTSSLAHVLRLLRQVLTLQLKTETSCVADNALEELEEYEAQHSTLETKLNSAAVQLQGVLSQMQSMETRLIEQDEDAARTDKCVLQLLQQVEEGLSTSGLQHFMAITSPRRRSTLRTLEDITSAMTLLLGELTRKTSRSHTLEEELQRCSFEIESLREAALQKEARMRTSDLELQRLKEHNNRDYTSLKHCLAQAEESLNDSHAERARLSELIKKQTAEHETTRQRLQQQVSELQRTMDSRVSDLEHSLHDAQKKNQAHESTIAELRNQLSLKADQVKLVDEENGMLVEGLRSTLKHQQAEIDQLRMQLDLTVAEKQSLSKRVVDLETELHAEQEKHQKVQEEASVLRSDVRTLKVEHAETLKILQDKVDNSGAIKCDLERQIRSADFKLLQLRTEMQMERHRSAALAEENSDANKKIQSLQERIWSLTRRRRFNSGDKSKSFDDYRTVATSSRDSSSEYGSCISLLSSSLRADTVDHVQSLVKDVGDGQMREEQLHAMLREKDLAMRSLQESVSTQINNKNQELEELTGKVSILEEQLSSLLSGLEVSAAIGNVTTEVGRLLQQRTEHLKSIDHSSQWLQEEVSSLAMENHILNAELDATKKNQMGLSSGAQDSARRAREEARQERLNATRMQEKCLRLQAQLEAVQTTLDHERQEKKMRETVRGVKHHEFSLLLENATAVQESLEKM